MTADRGEPDIHPPRPADGRVTVISVAYNSGAVIGAMLDSLPAGTDAVVVDNASRDDSAEIAEKRGASVVRLAANEGFGRGCNVGARGVASEFLLFLNPDARLGEGAVAALVAAARRHPRASAFNPVILGSDGRPQIKRRSRLLPAGRTLARGVPGGDVEVGVLSGAALFCRRAAFEAVGGFDPRIFLYHEDDDLSLRLERECGPLMLAHEARVTHAGLKSSTPSLETERFRFHHMARSRVYACRKHGRPFPLLLGLWSGVRRFLSPSYFASAEARAKARGYLGGVVSTITDPP